MVSKADLALWGGTPVRTAPFPPRVLFGCDELDAVEEVFRHSWDCGVDFGYQGKFEEEYCRAFCSLQGEGFADVVCTGTMSVFVAIAALGLSKGAGVLVSPITDPGTINAIIFNGLVPVLVDSMPGSYNIGPEQVRDRLTDDVEALVVVHATGKAAPIEPIVEVVRERGIKVIEDCSQAHGATYRGKKVGTFGDIAAFSTMYRKGHATGASGGVVYTRDEELYRMVLAHADRGKPSWQQDYDPTDPTMFLFPALNLHSDELSCAIGIKTLTKLSSIINRRQIYLRRLSEALEQGSQCCQPSQISGEDAPFFFPIFVDEEMLSCDKEEFAHAVKKEGVLLNPHYKYVVREWPWVIPYLYDDFPCENSFDCRNRSFNILLNENYGEQEIDDTVRAIQKVESVYLKS